MSRLEIGIVCERRIAAALGEMINAQRAQAMAAQQLEWAKARDVPVDDRAEWITSDAGREYLEDVDFARREDQAIPAESEASSSQLLHIKAHLGKGEVKRLLEEVAHQYGVSLATVRKCRAEYLTFKASDLTDL